MSGAIGPGDWVKVVRSGTGTTLGLIGMVTGVEPPGASGCECEDRTPHAGLHVTCLAPNPLGYCIHCFSPFHGTEQSSLGLSRKLPTCEPV